MCAKTGYMKVGAYVGVAHSRIAFFPATVPAKVVGVYGEVGLLRGVNSSTIQYLAWVAQTPSALVLPVAGRLSIANS